MEVLSRPRFGGDPQWSAPNRCYSDSWNQLNPSSQADLNRAKLIQLAVLGSGAMDSSDLEKLLEPLSDDSPCGPDLEYDAEFGKMERAAQGKPEQQFGDTIVAPEPPDWKDVRNLAQSLLERTKDMRVVVHFARASLHLDGLPGFQLALQLLQGYVETYWDSVHPELDHSDNDDPTYRTNTLITLCGESFLQELKEAALVSSRAMGQFSLRDIEQARDADQQPIEKPQGAWAEEEGKAEAESESSGPTPATIDAAFSDAAVEDLQVTEEATRLAAEHVAAIEQYVTEQVGVAQAVSLAPVQSVLQEMNGVLVSQLERRGVYTDEEAEQSEEVSEPADGPARDGGGGAALRFDGRISTREEAIRVLDSVCEYYERNEPSSPLPLLIRRAKRLASKSFLDILRDLAPDAVSQAEALGGGAGGSSSGYGEEIEQSGGESEKSSNW